MTPEAARTIGEGDTVTNKYAVDFHPKTGEPVRRPLRVTKVHVNPSGTVSVRLHSIAGQDWLDATGYDFPEPGTCYDRVAVEWITTGEMARRKAERRK